MSLIAASALMIDYVMTVAVSTVVGGRADHVGVPGLVDERVLLGVVAIVLITIGNLRGLREAGNIFAIPTYLFLGSALLMIAIGDVPDRRPRRGRRPTRRIADQIERHAPAGHDPAPPARLRRRRRRPDRHGGDRDRRARVQAARGEERGDHARRDGRPCSAILFIGITFLAVNFAITPIDVPEKQTVIAQVARHGLRRRVIAFYLFQAFTALLLVLAANTTFNAFPRLLAILAGDGHMPRQFSLRGDRLAFSLRDHRPGDARGGADRHLRRRDPPAHPALRGRGVHRLHDQPDRHDPALAPRAVARLAAAAGDQCVRRAAHRRSSRSS